jgi:hypothetical protein
MTWRKWLVRGLVFSALGVLAGLGLLYHAWTNPAAVRRLVLDKLGVRFLNVSVDLESAHLRLLGGIAVHDLRMARSDGLDRSDFLYVPAAFIYHDKEQMLEGKVAIRKVELDRPQLRLVRQRDGSFNVKGIFGPVDLTERMPTLEMRHGTVVVEDQTGPPGQPLLEVKDVHLTIINDPLPTLEMEGTGRTDVIGPVAFQATISRATLAGHVRLQLPSVPVGPNLVQRLATLCPDLADNLRQLTGTASASANLAYEPPSESPGQQADGAPGPADSGGGHVNYEVAVRLHGGTFSHARLPLALEGIEAEASCANGRVGRAHLTARNGPARLEVRLQDLRLPAGPPWPDLDALVGGALEARVEHLPVTAELMARLPDCLRWVQDDYAPTGSLSVTFTCRRGGAPAPACKRWVFKPEGMTALCSYFPYPAEAVRGTVAVDASSADLACTIDLAGSAGGQPITVRGKVVGPRASSEVEVDVRGTDLLLDHRVLRALPAGSRKLALQFLPDDSRDLGLRARPMGKADFYAAIRRRRGRHRFENCYTIYFHDSALKYDLFPYPLEGVSGTLVIHPDHWECHKFRGTHEGGELLLDGRSYSLPPRPPLAGAGRRPQRIHVLIRGQAVKLDADFERALAPPGLPDRRALHNAWRTLALAGRLNFSAEVIDHPGQPQDIDVGVDIRGCTMKPTFFPYPLTDVSGSVRYAHGQVHLQDIHARHGRSGLGLRKGLLQLKPGGGFQAWLNGIRGQALLPDDDFLRALPEGLRQGVAPLRLHEALDVETALTLDAAPPPGPLKVWWDGGAVLRAARLHAGIDVTGATGQISCRGYHDGLHMHGVAGDLLLERATVLGQPLTNLHARLEVLSDSPDVVRLRDIKADLFGGTLGGEARLEVGPVLRYDVLLEALGVRLETFGRHNGLTQGGQEAELQGPARAAVHLLGEGGDLLGLKGNGRLDVTAGKMGRLPLLLDLLKAFGLRMPDRTAFEQAHLTFAIEGPQVRVQQLDLYGNALSLRGAGTLDLDGNNVNLDFSATPGRVTQVLPAGLDAIPQTLSSQLFKIKMRGKLGKGGMRLEKELVPGVVEPIKRALGNGSF